MDAAAGRATWQRDEGGVSGGPPPGLSDRQRRELEYHRRHAERLAARARAPVAFDIVTAGRRRWWNAYWHAYTRLMEAGVEGRDVLVVGCGFGDDAIRLSRLRGRVRAFDLSRASLDIAAARAAACAGGPIDLEQMPCESLTYPDGAFDLIVAVDILHHADIPATLGELRRVARRGCFVVCNEPYTHTRLSRIRESRLVDERVYPWVARWMHGTSRLEDLYVTEDERKLDERDLGLLAGWLDRCRIDCFNLLTGRVVPERYPSLARVDRLALRALGRRGLLLAGRVVVSGMVTK